MNIFRVKWSWVLYIFCGGGGRYKELCAWVNAYPLNKESKVFGEDANERHNVSVKTVTELILATLCITTANLKHVRKTVCCRLFCSFVRYNLQFLFLASHTSRPTTKFFKILFNWIGFLSLRIKIKIGSQWAWPPFQDVSQTFIQFIIFFLSLPSFRY